MNDPYLASTKIDSYVMLQNHKKDQARIVNKK